MRKTWVERNFRLSLSGRWIRDLSSRQLLVQIADVVNSEREQNQLKTPYQHPLRRTGRLAAVYHESFFSVL